MLRTDKCIYDVIIIGAGISGLVCGCYLSKAGMKVLIIEQHDKPGGYFTSFKRKGFSFDAAAHSFGNYREGGHVRKILAELEADKLLDIRRYNPSDIVMTPDFKITFWNNAHDTISDLTTLFPEEKNNIRDFFNFFSSSSQSDFVKLKDKTFDFLLHSFFKDERLISAIALPVFGNGGLPPSLMHAFAGSKIFSEFIIDGGYYSGDRIQNLPDALVRILTQHGGTVLYRKRVKKILLSHNMVKGVQLDKNKVFSSRYLVSACDMKQTFNNFLGEKIAGKQVITQLKAMIPSISTFILYIGITKKFEGLPEPGTNIWYLPYYDLDKIYHSLQQGDFDKAEGYMLRVSPDEKTITAYVAAPFKTASYWKRNKHNIAKRFLKRIENTIPRLQKHVAYFDSASPSTLYRYTHNYKGAAFGWAKIPSQVFDPVMSKTTRINGLFLTGHWTSIAFGLPGVCNSGYDTAKRILRRVKTA